MDLKPGDKVSYRWMVTQSQQIVEVKGVVVKSIFIAIVMFLSSCTAKKCYFQNVDACHRDERGRWECLDL